MTQDQSIGSIEETKISLPNKPPDISLILTTLNERIIQLAVNIALNQKLHLIGSLSRPIMPDRLAQLCYRTAQRQRLLHPDIVLIKKKPGDPLFPSQNPFRPTAH
ncbi:hypothetical protein OLMES_3144 [Oleiphilus messinensis]|uniref:Uncharacterized protein n=1 Tax=Oleiphilus messinensis TaxID=141451 RepID=A0A1Y0I9I2_9GAMM|nr:hypothetical protein OLMES_3144 [Oleiphilus messinensis]